MEKLVSFNDGVNPLTIDVYDCLINGSQENEEVASDEDLEGAYELGKECAENGEELSSDSRDYSMVAGEIISDERDNGYGASNDELEQFWQGYDNGTVISLDCVEDEYADECEEYEEKCDIPCNALEEIEKIICISKGF